MTVHLIKLCVGIEDVAHLQRLQKQRLKGKRGKARVLHHHTRMTPKRADEILDGGSLYWVIKGVVRVRQRIIGIEQGVDWEGRKACILTLDPMNVPVRPTPRRPFQGWRYLAAEDAPVDLQEGESAEALDPAMAKELGDMGLL
ncbi:MAG: DUF1489 family protein [Alphaproteobacteria bacterium]